MTETRYALCRFDAQSAKRTDEGYLDAPVQPTRAGVFTYWYGGKMVRELRRPEEVFKADSLASLENKPVTNGHPKDATGQYIFLDGKTAKDYAVGMVHGKHDKADDGIHTSARVMIYDEAMIKQIEAGKVQVSCAYQCDFKDEPGTYDGIDYDREQINIRGYNHLAVLDRGRAGSGSAIRLDGAEIDPDEIKETSIKGDQPMIKYKLDGIGELEISEQSVQTVADVNEKLKTDAAQIETLMNQVQQLTDERDEFKGKFDAQSNEIAELKKAQAEQQVNALREKASAFVESKKLDGLDERAIKEAVIAAKYDGLDLSEKSEGEINGMFALATMEPPKETPNMKKVDAAIGQAKPYQNIDLIALAAKQNRGA